MSEFKKNNLFDYNNDGEMSLTEYIIGEKTIEDSNKSIENDIFGDESDEMIYDIFESDEEEED